MPTRNGTCHFVSLAKAVSYYARQEISRHGVMEKLQRGEIFIGQPTAPRGSTVGLNVSEGRYFIEDAQS